MDADRIIPGLYLGSSPLVYDCSRFDVVVLAARELQQPPYGSCRVIHAPFNDTRQPSREEVLTALQAARKVRAELQHGQRVLVSCAAGINRSALIVALVLMMEGASASQAIRLVRNKRKPPWPWNTMVPLANPAFVQILQCYKQMKTSKPADGRMASL
jgi:protein-tyrosine phosphatase